MIVHGVSPVLPALVWPPWGPADGQLCHAADGLRGQQGAEKGLWRIAPCAAERPYPAWGRTSSAAHASLLSKRSQALHTDQASNPAPAKNAIARG